MRPHNLLIFFLPMAVGGGDCNGKSPCYIDTWTTWGPCIGTCGFYFQERSRSLCCPYKVQPHTLENCVHYCNITEGVNERRYCILCGNGTVDYSTMDCLCKPYYKGKCCQELVTCNDSPCVHGTCGDSPSGYVCHCENGYKGIDCGDDVKKEKVPWQSVMGYLFLAVLPFCILFSIFYICVKCCPFWKKTSKRVDHRPKPIGADENIRELTWERVTSHNFTFKTPYGLHDIQDRESNATNPLHGVKNDPQYRKDLETFQVSKVQNLRQLPISKPVL